MTIKSILLHFAVYCILRGNSETIPEIAYEVQDLENEVLLLPLNNVPVKRNQTAKYDSFVLMAGRDATIALYGKTTLTLVGIRIYDKSKRWLLHLDQVFYAKENSHKYYVKTNPIYSNMGGEWEITFRFDDYKHISKTITVHIRPSKVSKVPIVSAKPDNLIATQIASYTIKDFDAFGCLVYKDQDDLAMRCKPSTNNTNLMEWSLKEHSNTTSGREAAYYNNRLKSIHDGSYMDCIQHMIGDTITVRIFLVLSSSKSWPNNNSAKPISNDDREGCVKYVSSLYGPEVLKPTEPSMSRVHTRNKIIPIQRANSSFQDFDGFGCVLYDSHASLDLYCRKSRTNSAGIHWKAATDITSSANCGKRDFCMVSLNLPGTGTTHMDCTEQLSEDNTTVRIFFIHNNNDTTIPSSEKDRVGCFNYVTRYYALEHSNGEPKTIFPDDSRKRQKGRPQNTNISSSPTPQNGPTGNHFSHIHHKPGPPAEHPTSPWQPNTNHRWNNTPRSPNKSPLPNITFPEPPPPPSKPPSHFEHNTNAHRQSHLNNNDKPPNAKTDKDLNNKNVFGWWPKQSTAINSPIANSTLSTPTVFHDFKNKTGWPALGPETDTARQSQTTTVSPDITLPPPPPSVSYRIPVIIVAAAVGIIIISIILILCVRKNKVVKRNENLTSSAVYYANTSSPNLNRRSDNSDHLYCYIDVNSLPHPKEIPKPRVPLVPCGEESGNGETNEIYTNPRQVNSNEVSAEQCDNTIEEAEDVYSYVYADRFDILSILRSQEEARK